MSLTVNDRTYVSGKAEIRFGSTAVGLKKITLGDKLNKELLRRIGSQEIAAQTEGEYEVEDMAVELESSVWKTDLLPALPANGYGNFPFVITIYYTDDLLGFMRIDCLGCTIKGVKDSVEAGPGAIMTELTIGPTQIVRNGKTLNRRVGANAVTVSIGFEISL